MNHIKLAEAADLVGFHDIDIDFPLIVGALSKVKELAKPATTPLCTAKTKMRQEFRTLGQRLIDAEEVQSEQEQNDDFVLRITRTTTGRWEGKLYAGEVEIGTTKGFDSPEEVSLAATESGIIPGRTEILDPT